MAERAKGFYWVNDAGWRVAEWVTLPGSNGGWWCLPGESCGFQDGAFAEIDPRRIERQADMPVYGETKG